MGWKNLKEKFGIKHHVQVTEKGLCIGSGFVSEIIVIDPVTGQLEQNEAFRGFVRAEYPALLQATPEELVALISAPDTFYAAISVYTFDGAEIIEKKCEAPGWPNVTVDGCMMYENLFSTNKAFTVARAKHSAELAVENTQHRIEQVELELARLRSTLAKYQDDRAKLEAAYPAIPAAS